MSGLALIPKTWHQCVRQTYLAQDVEDVNALHNIRHALVRRLIVMPLSKAFNPNQFNPMHDRIEYGDKCSFPDSIGKLLIQNKHDVPWIFEVKVISRASPQINSSVPSLNITYASPLDFRAPENYMFMPQWMMQSLNIRPFDIVDVSFVRLRLASLVVLQPMDKNWDMIVRRIGDEPLASLLENELNKYSSITANSEIRLSINGEEVTVRVFDVKDDRGVSMWGARLQDSEVRVDINRNLIDTEQKR